MGLKANWRPAVKVSKKGEKRRLSSSPRGEGSLFKLWLVTDEQFIAQIISRQIWLPQCLGLQHLEPGYLRVSSATGQLPDPPPAQPSPPKKVPKKRQAGVKTPRVPVDNALVFLTSHAADSRSTKVMVKRTPTTVMLDRARHRLSTVLTGLISHDRRLTQRIVELARDPLSYFGNLVRRMVEGRRDPPPPVCGVPAESASSRR